MRKLSINALINCQIETNLEEASPKAIKAGMLRRVLLHLA